MKKIMFLFFFLSFLSTNAQWTYCDAFIYPDMNATQTETLNDGTQKFQNRGWTTLFGEAQRLSILWELNTNKEIDDTLYIYYKDSKNKENTTGSFASIQMNLEGGIFFLSGKNKEIKEGNGILEMGIPKALVGKKIVNLIISLKMVSENENDYVGLDIVIQKIISKNGIVYFGATTTGVEKEIQINDFVLEQNYPNPFNPTTKIRYTIPVDSEVNISVSSLLGEKVAELVSEYHSAGTYEVEFNASNLTNGVYFYTLRSGQSVQTKKMILVK